MSISARCRIVRTHLGLSARAMAEQLDVANSLWTQYELGLKEPNSSTLLRLHSLGISIDWLISGSGQMLLNPAKNQSARHGQEASSLKEIAEALSHLMGTTHGRRLLIWSSIVELLSKRLEALSAAELTRLLPGNFEEEELTRELELMQQEGLIGCSKGRYRLIRVSRSHDVRAADLRLLMMLKRLLEDFLPRFKASPLNGKLVTATIKTARGRGVERAKALMAMVNEWQEVSGLEQGLPDSDSIDIYMAVIAKEANRDEQSE